MRTEGQDTGNDRKSTGTSGAGHRNCTVAVQCQMQTPQLLTAAAMETVELKMTLNTLSMQPCVCSPRQVQTPHVWHQTLRQLQRSSNVLTVLSTATQQMKLQRCRINCHQNCIHSHCTDGTVMPQMWVVRHSLLVLPLWYVNQEIEQFNHSSTSAICALLLLNN